MMTLANQKVAVVGLGQTGQSVIGFLIAQHADIKAFDTRKTLQVQLPAGIVARLGELDSVELCQMDLIVLSPGVALATAAIQQAVAAGVEVIGDIELFARFNTVPVLAITGSNGKSTVTMLLAEMLKTAGNRVLVGGNIGVPALSLLNQPADFIVLELSSFQLETTTTLKLLAATVLNVTDDHMDRYTDFAAYQRAKLTIFDHAKNQIVNRDDKAAQVAGYNPERSFGLSASVQGFSFDQPHNKILFNGENWLDMDTCILSGQHNVLNIQAAAALGLCAGASHQSLQQASQRFEGLPHRCQLVSHKHQVSWINDSKATNVGATIAAIQGLRAGVQGKLLLIAGGDGKGADLTELLPVMDSVDVLITLGKDGDQIARLKSDAIQVNSLQQAVQVAATQAQAGDMVLLSPACASLDMFANYMQRGEQFALAVEAL
ncbi:UDP-N-acetylmuramoyl-L-alanine--D-glutamate ligase [Neptunicella sp. SCSIO 80796]|uniref:UDP-N-acetylmuramoyl-L-alanine--D-glutamate ligase n=1 Tax=Neptunicella plasticusilytica TaxID=3117012 RepID=UPI003A4DFF72